MAAYRASTSAVPAPASSNDTMPKLGHVTEVREAWLVRTDGALAHHLQDREISSHLCENRYRNRQIREDFPMALGEQQVLEFEARQKELERIRQAERDEEMAREIAEINLRRRRREDPTCSRRLPPEPTAALVTRPAPIDEEIDVEALGLSRREVEEMRCRLEQEERDARLARELSHEESPDALLSDMRVAVEAQDGELARLLQEREYKKLQKAKEKARQKALLKKQQKLAESQQNQSLLLDAYSNPRDLLQNRSTARLSKSVDSDLNYVEPFQKEHIESRASALRAQETSKQLFSDQVPPVPPPNRPHDRQSLDLANNNLRDYGAGSRHSMDLTDNPRRWRHPPLPPSNNTKKPRFPDPVSIRPASRYPSDLALADSLSPSPLATFNNAPPLIPVMDDRSSRHSVTSDELLDSMSRKKSADQIKKKKGCKIQ